MLLEAGEDGQSEVSIGWRLLARYNNLKIIVD